MLAKNHHAHAPDDESREYLLSAAAKAEIWAELARITPALTPIAADVLRWMTAEALRNGSTSLRASCREIEGGTGRSRSHASPATKALVAMGLIAKREGHATKPAAYILRYAETLRMSGSKREPPSNAGLVPSRNQGGSQREPLKHEIGPLFEMEPCVQSIDSSDLEITRSIDRSNDPPPNEANAAECKALMTAVVRHCGRSPGAHPPDATMVKLMLRVAEWDRVQGWLHALLKWNTIEMPASVASPYAWLIAVALQKIQGIAPADQKPTLLLMRKGQQLITKPEPWKQRRAEYLEETGRADQLELEQPSGEFRDDLDKSIAATAAGKRME